MARKRKTFDCTGCGQRFKVTKDNPCESGLCEECCIETCWEDEIEDGATEAEIREIRKATCA